MARYIKVNPKVAQHLNLTNSRNQLKDGNYLLWQADMLAFGRLCELPQILEQIGGIALLAYEAREEQDGTVLRDLPTATDVRFIIEKPAADAPSEMPGTYPDHVPAEAPDQMAQEETDKVTTENTINTNKETKA